MIELVALAWFDVDAVTLVDEDWVRPAQAQPPPGELQPPSPHPKCAQQDRRRMVSRYRGRR